MQIQGKVAVVTGAASGLGRAVCEDLARAGARVAGFDVAEDGLASLEAALGAGVSTHVVDVADEDSVRAGFAASKACFGAIHIVVNCAGVADAAKTVSGGEPFPLKTWEKVIGVNLTGTFNMLRFAALEMTANEPDSEGERGIVINTSSGAAWQGQMGQMAYSASKAAVMGLTLPAARDLAAHGIRIVSIAPGLFDTPMVQALPPKVSEDIIGRMTLFPKRMGRSCEFAALARSIIENVYINATTISLDGGTRIV